MSFDFIATGRPVNKVAAQVLSPGEHYDKMEGTTFAGHSQAPMAMRGFGGPAHHNLTGRRFGQFTVIGLAADTPKTRWVCRCSCGDYEYRSAHAITNPENAAIDRCSKCRDLVWIRRHDQRRREMA